MISPNLLRTCLWEFLAMTLFVYAGCGVSGSGVGGTDRTGMALVWGLLYASLVYVTAHYSGGHCNPAVTISLMITEDVKPKTGVCIIVSQILGSIIGAAILYGTFASEGLDASGNLGSNVIGANADTNAAWAGEILMTYLLVTVTYQCGSNRNAMTRSSARDNPTLAPLACGFVYFVAMAFLAPIDGGSINPARSFGPAVVSGATENLAIFIFAPLIGAILAAVQERGSRVLNVVADAAREAEKLADVGMEKPLSPRGTA